MSGGIVWGTKTGNKPTYELPGIGYNGQNLVLACPGEDSYISLWASLSEEYGLNQLGTTWEQFRVRLMDADMFKNAVDNVNELVKRVNSINFSNPFDFTKFAVGVPLMLRNIKNMSVSFIKTF